MHDTMHGIYSRRDKQTTHTPVSGHTKAHKQSRAHQRGERTDRPRGTHVGQVSPTYGPVLRELADLLVAPVRGYQFHEILSIIINHVQCVFSKQHRHRYRPTQLSNIALLRIFLLMDPRWCGLRGASAAPKGGLPTTTSAPLLDTGPWAAGQVLSHGERAFVAYSARECLPGEGGVGTAMWILTKRRMLTKWRVVVSGVGCSPRA